MAIHKSKTLKNGVVGDYWKLTKLSIDLVALTTNFELSLYLDSTHGNDGVSGPIYRKQYSTNVTLAQIMSGSVAGLYSNILAKANTMVPTLGGGDDHVFDSDLAGGSIVS